MAFRAVGLIPLDSGAHYPVVGAFAGAVLLFIRWLKVIWIYARMVRAVLPDSAHARIMAGMVKVGFSRYFALENFVGDAMS